MGKSKNIILWILQIGLAAAFIGAGWPKLAGAQVMVDMFNTIGIGQWFRYVTGGLEILSAVLLLIPGMAGIAAAILTCVMTGAILTHLTILHSPPKGPVILLVLAVVVLVGRWSQLKSRLRPARIVTLTLLLAAGLPAQTQSPQTKPWTQPKTSWGDPDIQGVWPGTAMIGTPLERDRSLGTRAFLTEDEFAKRQERAAKQANIDEQETVNDVTRCDPGRGGLGNTPTTCSNGVSIGPPLYWDDRGKPSHQASLVVDPPDGRIPALAPEAQKAAAERAAARRARPCSQIAGGCHDTWLDESLWDRCITRGAVGSIVPNTYNQGNQILQIPGYVVLRNEMIHETRIIPVSGPAGGTPHLPAGIRSWMGDSRGHWEGNTLVVETTNFRDGTVVGQTPASDELRLIEHFSRVSADTLNYSVTIDDPKTWTRPWTISFPLKSEPGYVLYEYACHEGNYYMLNALKGARADEKAGK